MAERPNTKVGDSIDPHLQKEADGLLRKVSEDPAITTGTSESEDLLVLSKQRVGVCILMVVKVSHRLLDALTARERQVASLIGHGLRNKGIGAQLGISEKQTAHLLEQIKLKWGVRTRAEIARCALLLL